MLKRNEASSLEKTWKKLKVVVLSERIQSEKTTHCMILTIWHFEQENYGDVRTSGGREDAQAERRGPSWQ